jgi:hypothetical protein
MHQVVVGQDTSFSDSFSPPEPVAGFGSHTDVVKVRSLPYTVPELFVAANL